MNPSTGERLVPLQSDDAFKIAVSKGIPARVLKADTPLEVMRFISSMENEANEDFLQVTMMEKLADVATAVRSCGAQVPKVVMWLKTQITLTEKFQEISHCFAMRRSNEQIVKHMID